MEPQESKSTLFRCNCGDISHVFDVSYYEDIIDKKRTVSGKSIVYREVVFQVLLNPNYRLIDKIKNAFKYVFGKWDKCWVASICISDIKELKQLRDELDARIMRMETIDKKIEENV